MLMWDAYRGLTWAGLDLSIHDASGTDPDCLARPAPEAEQQAPEVVAELTDGGEARIEAEHSTGTTKPGATVRHVCQAAAEGRTAVVLCRPEAEAAVRETIHSPPSLCRSDHEGGDEVRYYTSPRDLRIDGEVITRPGGRENVWIREHGGDGDIVLRDASGTEYARFESREAVFTRSDPYPSGGANTVKRPVIPDTDPDHVTIVVVPDGADSLDRLRIGARPPVPEKCEPLWELLSEEVGPDGAVSKLRASELAEAHDLGVSQATVYRHMGALEDAGCLVECGEGANGATLFALA
jgi:hypothetical protein